LLELLATPLALLNPIPLKIAVDSVVNSLPLPRFLTALLPGFLIRSALLVLGVAAALQVLAALLSQLRALATYWLRTQTGERLTLDFRGRLLHHLQRLSLSFHDTRGTADSIYRIQNDAPSVKQITIDGLIPVISKGVMLLATLYVIVRIDWQLALVALAISPFLVLCARVYDRRVGGRYRGVKELESFALHVVQEVLSALRLVKAFGREDSERERFVLHSGESVRARVRLSLAEGVFGLIVGLTISVGTALVLFIGIRNVQSGRLTLGELLMVFAYLAQLYGPLEAISHQAAGLQSSLAGARRAFEVLDEAPVVADRPHARPLTRAAGAVEFQDVSFAYDGKNPVLRNISFAVPPGTRVGIAGKTGAGKTTLVSLLVRFYDPTSGRILLDGVDLCEYRVASMRNQFALVLQEPVLFSTSISENIAYARPDATEREIVEAAKAANAHDFIVGLPHGYRTEVGERGMMISGGERQRISLARAFLKDAPMLVLDEPTSAVDMKTEAGILEAMDRLMRGRTSFLISHRLSALKHCDAILNLDDGHLAEVTQAVVSGR
jgi:ATP-binding cassette subfamily B protein